MQNQTNGLGRCESDIRSVFVKGFLDELDDIGGSAGAGKGYNLYTALETESRIHKVNVLAHEAYIHDDYEEYKSVEDDVDFVEEFIEDIQRLQKSIHAALWTLLEDCDEVMWNGLDNIENPKEQLGRMIKRLPEAKKQLEDTIVHMESIPWSELEGYKLTHDTKE